MMRVCDVLQEVPGLMEYIYQLPLDMFPDAVIDAKVGFTENTIGPLTVGGRNGYDIDTSIEQAYGILTRPPSTSSTDRDDRYDDIPF